MPVSSTKKIINFTFYEKRRNPENFLPKATISRRI